MNTLILRTRIEQSTPSSSSSRGSFYTKASPLRGPVRATRPVFISSPTPKRQPARLRRIA